MEAGILVPILISLGSFAMVFGLRYLSNKENMAMIERGITPVKRPRDSSGPMRFGLLMFGAGIGLMLAFWIDKIIMQGKDNELQALYFGCILIFGGAALFIAYLIEKNNTRKNTEQ